jgi:hypothetical protein
MGRIGFEVKQLLQPFLDRGPFCIGDYVVERSPYFLIHASNSSRNTGDLVAVIAFAGSATCVCSLGSGGRARTIGAILY